MLMLKKHNPIMKIGYTALLLCIGLCSAFAQKTVTGRVISNGDKQPIPGASVQVRNSSIATQTGKDGAFSIRVPADSSALIITVVGYEQLELPTIGKTSMGDVVLHSTIATLNDVVVTGYTA